MCWWAAEYLVVPGLAVKTQSASSGIGTLHVQFVYVEAGQLPRGIVKNGCKMESMRVTSLSWLAPVRLRWLMRSRLVFYVSRVCVLPAVSLRLARRSELLSMVSQATWKSKSVWIRFIHICSFDLICLFSALQTSFFPVKFHVCAVMTTKPKEHFLFHTFLYFIFFCSLILSSFLSVCF